MQRKYLLIECLRIFRVWLLLFRISHLPLLMHSKRRMRQWHHRIHLLHDHPHESTLPQQAHLFLIEFSMWEFWGGFYGIWCPAVSFFRDHAVEFIKFETKCGGVPGNPHLILNSSYIQTTPNSQFYCFPLCSKYKSGVLIFALLLR